MERFSRVIMFAALCSVTFAFPNPALVSNALPNRNVLVYPDHTTNDIYVVEFPEDAPDWAIYSAYDELNSNNELNQNVDNSALDKAIIGTDEIEVDNHQTEGSSLLSAKDLDQESLVPQRRQRRQAPQMATGLASSHTDSNGRDRPVGRVHGDLNLRATGNDRNNYHASGTAGLGSVVYRSSNNRHSVGVGAAVDQYRGRHRGYQYRGRPNVGVGLGYSWRF